MSEDTETRPQDQRLWEQWERHSTPDEHLRSPRRITGDGRWQRWCSCGWRGPLCENASQARQSHFTHLATIFSDHPDYRQEPTP